jgi:hypothetical protein
MADAARDPLIPRWLWLADALIVLLLALAAWIALFSGALWSIGPLTLSLRSPSRILLIAVAIAGLTWIAQPSVPPARRWARRLDAFRVRFPLLGAVLPIVIGTRLGVLLVGLMAVKLIGFPAPLTGKEWETIWPDDLVNLPWRWDTGWFTGIAIDGYTWDTVPTNEQSIVFFPGFPLLMRLGATLLLHPQSPVAVVWSGVVISWIAFTLACVYIYKLTREEFGDDVGLTAVMLLAAYPFAVFFSTAYSESLFLCTIVAAFYHFRRREMLPAAIFGLAAGLTRMNGCMLSVILAAVIVFREWAPGMTRTRAPFFTRLAGGFTDLLTRDGLRALLVAAMPGIGLLLYAAFIGTLTGDPLAWLKRQEAWHRDIHLFDPRLIAQFHMPRFWLDAVAFALSLVALWPIATRLGFAAALFTALTTLLPFLNGGLLSVGRFTSIVFPIFIWMAITIPPSRRVLAATIFGMSQALVACAFFTNRPIY